MLKLGPVFVPRHARRAGNKLKLGWNMLIKSAPTKIAQNIMTSDINVQVSVEPKEIQPNWNISILDFIWFSPELRAALGWDSERRKMEIKTINPPPCQKAMQTLHLGPEGANFRIYIQRKLWFHFKHEQVSRWFPRHQPAAGPNFLCFHFTILAARLK